MSEGGDGSAAATPPPRSSGAGTRTGPPAYGEADLARIRTVAIARRPNKVSAAEFAGPPGFDHSFRAFLDSLPDVLVARDFRRVVDAIVNAVASGKAVVVMLGGHVVKTGLAPLIVDLMRRGVITHLAMNGSAAIHDYEIARFGATSEDVAAGLKDGTFGMAEETGRGLNEAFVDGMARGAGMGESVALALDALDHAEPLAHPELSVLLNAWRLGVPATVHAALGAEIIHQHPAANGAAIGDTSHRDFRRLAASLPGLDGGGVVLNLGSAVIMPEVFLKALTIARNLNGGLPRAFVTCDLDMQRHYRPRMNVVQRPTLEGGRGYEITGHHEIMVPLLAWAVAERLEER
ncbi:MAG TPA: hypothetical protein VFJ74_04875 [Gemmatimonadaceae bacterium]|nr:hypothetical protein [Gemmatimonadaceae bacterium]